MLDDMMLHGWVLLGLSNFCGILGVYQRNFYMVGAGSGIALAALSIFLRLLWSY